jgi:cysteinyl-tRNA synthetase
MYHCGPTVYDRAHIGNLRSFVIADLLRRTMEYNEYEVRQIMNITDVGHLTSDADEGEDKMMRGLKKEGLPATLSGMKSLAQKYAEIFKIDISKLNIVTPDVLPFASEHIQEQIKLVEKLMEKEFAYKNTNGIYFDTAKDSHYDVFGVHTDEEQETGRVQNGVEKKNPRDFVLWKFNSELGWDSPWGKGFPGWHIECSAMSMKYLGESFDIHTGGIEHIPIHHTNEIAQSKNATGLQFVNYWIHNNHLTVDGKKMAKSEGTGYTLEDIIKKDVPPLALRYFFFTAHYRTLQNFTLEALSGASQTLQKLQKLYVGLGEELGEIHSDYKDRFNERVNDDIDMPGALAVMWELLKDHTLDSDCKKATLLDFDRILGLGLESLHVEPIPIHILDLIAEREKAREEKNWEKADALRKEIEKSGYVLNDTSQGPRVSKIY